MVIDFAGGVFLIRRAHVPARWVLYSDVAIGLVICSTVRTSFLRMSESPRAGLVSLKPVSPLSPRLDKRRANARTQGEERVFCANHRICILMG